jgi:Spy/CpxP family protein refolding chaperone
MKFSLKKILLGLAGGALVLGTLSACSGRHSGHGSEADQAKFQGRMVEMATKKLDLTEPQKQQLTVLADKLQQQRAALMGANKDPRAELQALLAGPKLDKSKAQALLDEKTGAIKSKSPEVIAAAAEFYDSLSPAQQQQIRDLMSRRRHGWGG